MNCLQLVAGNTALDLPLKLIGYDGSPTMDVSTSFSRSPLWSAHKGKEISSSLHLYQATCAVATFKENHCVNTKVFIC
jgi:hypothetical protein